MRIYTKSGDKGMTSLIYGDRVPKNDLRVEAYGTCDELNSTIGLASSFIKETEWDKKEEFLEILLRIQTILFHVGSELATPKDKEVFWKLQNKHIEELEGLIDRWQSELKPLTKFILPTGHRASATLHCARTLARRTERIVVGLDGVIENPLVLMYLNRLSDFLFVAARYVNHCFGVEDLELKVDL